MLRNGAAVALVLALGACASSVAPRGEAVMYPQPPDPPRVQFLRSISTIADVLPKRSGLDELLFGERVDEGELQRPFGCAVHRDIVYVTDTRFGAVVAIDLRAKTIGTLDLGGRARPKKPTTICFGADDRMFYADVGRRQVVVVGADRRHLAEFGPWGDDSKPAACELVGDRLYVVDTGQKLVRVLAASDGAVLATFGQDGEPEHRLQGPTAIAVDEAGFSYVTDTIQCRVFVFDRDGKFVRHIGEPGDVIGQFARPKGLATAGRALFVLDAAFENCQAFSKDGRALMFFGGSGTGPGSMYLPADVWVGADGLSLFADELEPDFEPEQLIVVTSQFGPRKVSFYALGTSKKFRYPDVDVPESPTPEAVGK
jgi:hypothetical protein